MERFTGARGAQWTYDPGDRIGDRSALGRVFRGRGADGIEVAVKRVLLAEPGERTRETAVGERLALVAAAGVPVGRLVVPLDHGFAGDHLFIVMPLADESLRAALVRGPFERADGFAAVRDVAEGLMQLAPLPILHRDLKPANVLRFDDGWRIADFDSARDLSAPAGATDFLPGTAAYRAPEVWAGRPATRQSDLYSLGVLAYEVFAGRLPFDDPDPDRLGALHRFAPAPDLYDAPAGLSRLVVRLLQKDPSDRPQDARAVLEALDRVDDTLAPRQRALVDAALDLQLRRGRAAAAADQEVDRRARASDRQRQARSDLVELFQQAYGVIERALPDARFDRAGPELSLDGVAVHAILQAPSDLAALAVPRASLLGYPDPPPRLEPETVLIGHLRCRPTPHRRGGDAPELPVIMCESANGGRLRWMRTASLLTLADREPLTADFLVQAFIEAIRSTPA